jgi:hypothetical protein
VFVRYKSAALGLHICVLGRLVMLSAAKHPVIFQELDFTGSFRFQRQDDDDAVFAEPFSQKGDRITAFF